MRRFTFRPIPALLTTLMLLILVGLGSWQVQRLNWKQNLIATIQNRTHLTPVDVRHIAAADADFRPAFASGLFQHDQIFFLTAISLDGQGGYHVLTPLQLEDGRFLLVDRGWIPYDRMQGKAFDQPIDPVTITGILRLPQKQWMMPPNNPDANLWYAIDLPQMAQKAGVSEFLPFVLQANDAPNQGGYPVGGQTRLSLPNNHLVYAITWYGLALALLVIYGIQSRRR